MGLFSRRQRPPEVRTEKKIRFVCAQDGVPEQELKTLLTAELASSKVERAYLARIEYSDPAPYEVALCLRAAEDPSLVPRIADHFAKVFGRDLHMDILFLTKAQEEELARVCDPF